MGSVGLRHFDESHSALFNSPQRKSIFGCPGAAALRLMIGRLMIDDFRP
jgi:hypothetical protein